MGNGLFQGNVSCQGASNGYRSRCKGLQNLGNTCYMSAALQCLNATSVLSDYFTEKKFMYEMQRSARDLESALCEPFAAILKGLNGPGGGVSPAALKARLDQFTDAFEGYEQRDAQEFLAYLLDGLHEELNRVQVKQNITDPDINRDTLLATSEEQLSADAWGRYLKRNKSFIVDLFQGQIRSSVSCLQCWEISVRYDPVMYLTVPIPNKNYAVTLAECLKLYLNDSIMPDSQWCCPTCKVPRGCSVNLKLWKTPPILVVHLKRFDFACQKFTKVETPVLLPHYQNDFILDLGHFVDQKEPAKYFAYAVINHRGRMQFGHYTAICQDRRTRKWHEFDDLSVSEVSLNKVISEDNYVLFFQRKDILEAPLVKKQTISRPEDWPHSQP